MPRYSFTIEWSEEDEVFIATCPAFPGLSAFGDSPEEALREANTVLEAFIDIYREEGKPLPAPRVVQGYSGQTRLRMPRSLHARLAEMARREGVSLNLYMVSLLSEGVGLKRTEALAD